MPRILITGVAGFLGSNLAVYFRDQGWEVWGTFHSQEQDLKEITLRKLDICLPQAVESLVTEAAPQLVIHAAAMARPDDCAADPAATRQINVQGAKLVAAAAAKAGAHCIFTSTDQVLDGSQALSDESTAAKPLGVYGRSKMDAEDEVLKAAPGGLAVRLALCYGWGRGKAKGSNFAEVWLRSLLTSKPVRAFTDQYRSPIYVEDACQALLAAHQARLSGLLNVAGRERVSRYDFALHLAREFGFPEQALHAVSMDDVVAPDPRPKDASLNIDKLTRLTGFIPRDTVDGLKAMHTQLENL